MKLLEWLWNWLPDNCEAVDCPQLGVRGNENRFPESSDPRGYIVLCDYCLVMHSSF